MATIALKPMAVIKTVDGNNEFTQRFQEAASQTFKKGALVCFNSAGRIVECGANPPSIVGIALEDGHNYASTSTDNTVKVAIANSHTIFIGNLDASAVTALTDVGQTYGVAKDSTTGFWDVVKTGVGSGTANSRVIVLDLHANYATSGAADGEAIGDTQGRVYFQILGYFRTLARTS